MIIKKSVGVVSYGTYLPHWAIALGEIEQVSGKEIGAVSKSLRVEQKTVPAADEDTATIAVAAAQQALERAQQASQRFSKSKISSLFIGSESHPYAVKPTGTIVAQALGLPEELAMADLQFACKAGTQGMQICASYVLSGFSEYGLAVGADTAQAEPGDALEYSAAAGGAAYIFGKNKLIAKLLATVSVATDTPDFWRRPGEVYPQHGGRFTGEPAYFYHVEQATRLLLAQTKLRPDQIDYCIFHTPNGKFPRRVAKKLDFTQKQLSPSLVVEKIGNTYAGAVPLALASVLDQASTGKKILVTAYGSGAGADSFLFETTPNLVQQRKKWKNLLVDRLNSLENISYQEYSNLMKGRYH